MFEMMLGYHDARIVRDIVNQGIDSRLEAFVEGKSVFEWQTTANISKKLYCKIHPSEMQILIRRLLEYDGDRFDINGNNIAESLADSIVQIEYGVEVI